MVEVSEGLGVPVGISGPVTLNVGSAPGGGFLSVRVSGRTPDPGQCWRSAPSLSQKARGVGGSGYRIEPT